MLTSGLYPDFKLTRKTLTALADHIAGFSLAGIRSLRHL
jgi:hypothetical protein